MSKPLRHLERQEGIALRGTILERFEYDPDEGVIYDMAANRSPLPLIAEKTNPWTAKMRVVIEDKKLIASRVCWLLKTRYWPEGPVRCLNGDQSNLRWTNLYEDREYTPTSHLAPDEEEECLPAIEETNRRFLADLRRHHPNGVLSYVIRGGGIPVKFYQPPGSIGSPAAMCADLGGQP